MKVLPVDVAVAEVVTLDSALRSGVGADLGRTLSLVIGNPGGGRKCFRVSSRRVRRLPAFSGEGSSYSSDTPLDYREKKWARRNPT